MDQLAATLRAAASRGCVAELTGAVLIPRVEILFVADGGPDPSFRYLVGIYPVDDDLRGKVREMFRLALPDDTELTETQFHPLEIRR